MRLSISQIINSRSFSIQVLRGATFLSVGVGIYQLCNFAFRYILIHTWTPSDYGILTLILTIAGLFGMFTELNLNSATTIFLAKDIQNPRNKKTLLEILCTFALLTLFFIVVTFAMTRFSSLRFPFLDTFRQYFTSIWLLVVTAGIIAISYGLLRAHKKLKLETVSNIARGLSLFSLILVAVYIFQRNNIGLSVAVLLISQVICLLVAAFFILGGNLSGLKFGVSLGEFWRYLKGVSLSGIRSIFTFSLMLSFIGLPLMILTSIDKLMIPWLLSTEMLGFYGGALLIATIPKTITGTLATSLQIYVAAGSADAEQVRNQYLRFLGVFALLGIIGYGLFVVFAQYALLLLAEEYRWITTVLRTLLIGMFFSDIFSLNATFLSSIVHKIALRRIIGALIIAVIINVALNYFLIPRLGIEGAALATAVVFVMLGVVSMIEIVRLKI